MKLAQFRNLRKSQDSWDSFLRLYKQEMIAEEEERQVVQEAVQIQFSSVIVAHAEVGLLVMHCL